MKPERRRLAKATPWSVGSVLMTFMLERLVLEAVPWWGHGIGAIACFLLGYRLSRPRAEEPKPLPKVPTLVVDFMPNGLAILPKNSEWMYYNDACELALPYWIGDLPTEPRKAGEILVAEYARDYPEGFRVRREAFIHRKSLIAWLQRRQSGVNLS